MARLPVGLLLVIEKNPSVWPRRPSVWLRIIPRTGKFWKRLRGGDKTAAIRECRKLPEGPPISRVNRPKNFPNKLAITCGRSAKGIELRHIEGAFLLSTKGLQNILLTGT